ncbi:MAG: phosphatase PAP2 family protein [Ignavibacteriaceae bacterium]|jgi:membrane-associated PAP2 superfamily phosphatase
MKIKFFYLLFLVPFAVNIFAQEPIRSENRIDSTDVNINSKNNSADSLDITPRKSIAEKPKYLKPEYNLTWHDWLTNIPKDYAKFYDVATHTSLPVYFSIGASTLGLIATDNRTWLTQHEWYNNSNFVKQTSDWFAKFGDGRSQFALTGVFVAYGLLFKDQRALKTGSEILQVTISSGAFVQVLKRLTGRESPFVSTQPAGKWSFFGSPIKYQEHVAAHDAYPSGHLTTTLGMVVVIAENYPEWKWVKPLGYSICTLMAVSMVNNGIHWYSDYPLAIYLGYEFGKIVAHPEKYNSDSDSDDVSFNIMPYRSYNGTGLAMQLRF